MHRSPSTSARAGLSSVGSALEVPGLGGEGEHIAAPHLGCDCERPNVRYLIAEGGGLLPVSPFGGGLPSVVLPGRPGPRAWLHDSTNQDQFGPD